jgi:ferredoxin
VSLFEAAERFASLDRSQVILESKRCLHQLDQNSECTSCYAICPVGAITPGKPPTLAVEACQSCLACLPACPVGAYHADDAVSSLLNCIPRIETEGIELLCEVHPHPETGSVDNTGIRVRGCLAGLGSGTYLLLASMGVKKVATRTDACNTCKWVHLQAQIERQMSQSRMFLSVWDKGDCIVCSSENGPKVERPVWVSTNPPLSRRDLFRMMARQGQIALARAAEDGQTSQGKQGGRNRIRLLNAVKNLPAEHTSTSIGLKGLDFAILKVSDVCTACGVCATACPTQALCFEKAENDKHFTLSFSAPDCIGCDICSHVCAPAAISIDHNPSFEDVFIPGKPVVLQEGRLIRCAHCKVLMAERPGVEFCPICEFRRNNPLGSKFPPGMKTPEHLAKRKGNQ